MVVAVANYMYAVRRRLVMAVPLIVLAVLLGNFMADFAGESNVELDFGLLISSYNHPLLGGLFYTPVFLMLCSPIISYFLRTQVAIRFEGVGRSITYAMRMAFALSMMYALLLSGILFIQIIHSMGSGTVEGAFYVLAFLGYCTYFLSCALLLILVSLACNSTTTGVVVVVGYGLADYFAGMSPIRDIRFLHVGWALVDALGLGFYGATGAVVKQFCICCVLLMIVLMLKSDFDLIETL